MNTQQIKHAANLRVWKERIIECRASGQTVRAWCEQHDICPSTYYRWEREALSAATPEVFVEIPNSSRQCRNAAECSATLRIGENSIELYQEIGPELLLAMIKGLRSC